MERVNGFTKVLKEIQSEAGKFQTHLLKGATNKAHESRICCANSNFSSIHMNLNQCNYLFEDLR